MEKCEYRVRYAVPEMFHPNDRSRDIIHAIIGLDFWSLGSRIREIQKVGYPIVGVDKRIYDENERPSWDCGWKEVEMKKA